MNQHPQTRAVNREAQVELVQWKSRRNRLLGEAADKLGDDLYASLKKIEPELIKIAVAQSPEGKYPFGEPEKHVKFKSRWKAETTKGGDNSELRLWNDAAHAGFVIFPTRPHPIVARKAKVLRFQAKSGEVVFTRSVHHPGTKGNDVPGKSLIAAADVIAGVLTNTRSQLRARLVNIFD